MGRPITISVGPLAAGDPGAISTSQTAAGAQYLVINGAAATGTFSANNICTSQTPSGAGNLTLNGSTVANGVAYLPGIPTPQRIYITCAGDNSGVTFTISGTVYTLTGRPLAVTETITGADTNVVASSKLYSTITSIAISGASTGAVTVGTSGLATLDQARHVIITSGGTDTGITFTLSGTDWNNNPISETIVGADTTAAESVLSYKTVTSIFASGASADTLTVGTNTVADSPWVRFDELAANSQVAIQCDVEGTVQAAVSQTLDDPNVVTNQLPPPTYLFSPATMTWLTHPDSALASFTGDVQGNYAYAPTFARVTLSSGDGSVKATFQQAYLN